jgi:LPS-assembly protein
MYANKAEYQVDERSGTFYGVHGTSLPKIDARPGLLTTSNPFYFEGAYAEKVKDRIKLYDGFVTDCLVPRPAWKLTGHKFDIIPHDRAIAYHSIYRLRGIPIFYTPIFYKSLKKNPRRTGFLLPDVTHSSLYGWMTSFGVFLALGRSFDLTYHPEYMSLRGLSQAVEFRGRPTDKSDFDFTLHGVQDKLHQGGYVINAIGHDDLGGGWQAVGQINYLSNFLYRQAFNTSFTEAISSETHSVVDISKHWDAYGVNIDYSRDVNFQSTTPGDTILLRKLPEVEFIARDKQINDKVLPVWFSLDTTFGLLHRDQPDFQTVQFMSRMDFAPRVMTAFSWKGFSLVPSFTYRNTFYSESFNPSGQVVANSLVRNSRETDIEFVLPRLERVFRAPKIFGSKMKHVIEARANYRLVQGVQNFNQIIRFDSTELLTNTSEVEISLTNRFYVKSKDGEVKELLSWQLWQRRYFDPTFGGTVIAGIRNVNLSTIDLTGIAFLEGPRAYSPVVSAIRFQPNHLNFEWRADYDPKTGNIVDSAVSAGGRWDNYFVNFGSNQLRTGTVLAPSSNQFTASFGFGKPNKRGWNVGGTMFYDYRTSQLNYLSSQVTRNWDCCGLSVQYRRLNYGIIQNNVEQFSFSISNIGSFGTLRKQESLF